MAKTRAPVSLVKHKQQPASRGGTRTQTHIWTHKHIRAHSSIAWHSEPRWLIQPIRKEGQIKGTGDRERRKTRRVSEADRWRGGRGGGNGERQSRDNWDEGVWKCMVTLVGGRCEDSTAHQYRSEPNFSCPASIRIGIAMATHTCTSPRWRAPQTDVQLSQGLGVSLAYSLSNN